jgi:hypothetical protein
MIMVIMENGHLLNLGKNIQKIILLLKEIGIKQTLINGNFNKPTIQSIKQMIKEGINIGPIKLAIVDGGVNFPKMKHLPMMKANMKNGQMIHLGKSRQKTKL